jgi:hypothetical protein
VNPSPSVTEQLPPVRYTRTGRTSTSYGLFGRVAWTVGYLVVTGWMLTTNPILGVIVVVCSIVPFMRSVWARARTTR